MNWKASLLAAVVVIVAGGAVGLAIGGKTETKLRTVTVVSEAPPTPTTPTPTTPTTTTPTTGTTTPGGEPPTTSSDVPVQYLDEDDNPPTENLNIVNDTPHPRDQIGGETVSDAVIVELFEDGDPGPETVTYSPTSRSAKVLRARMGFEHGTEPGADLSVDFREDDEHGRKLAPTLRFHTPSARSVSVPLDGVRNVAIVFTNNCDASGNSGGGCEVYGETFVLGKARFTG